LRKTSRIAYFSRFQIVNNDLGKRSLSSFLPPPSLPPLPPAGECGEVTVRPQTLPTSQGRRLQPAARGLFFPFPMRSRLAGGCTLHFLSSPLPSLPPILPPTGCCKRALRATPSLLRPDPDRNGAARCSAVGAREPGDWLAVQLSRVSRSCRLLGATLPFSHWFSPPRLPPHVQENSGIARTSR